MRPISLCLCALLTGLALTAFSTPAPQDDHDDEEKTPLGEAMITMGKTMRGLRKNVRDPEAAALALEAVLICEAAALESKLMVPVMAAGIAEQDRAAFITTYRLEMIRFERALLDLEQALVEGAPPERARELLKAVMEIKDTGHEQFTEDG